MPAGTFADTTGKASAILFPTRVVMDGGQKASQINLVNRGTATGAYRLSLQDSAMSEAGSVSIIDDSEEATPFSIRRFVRFSPRRTQLTGRDNQNIRVQVRPPKDLPDGEYFGHLKVLVTSDNVEADNKEIEQDEEGAGFQLKLRQRSALAIPIIYRHGNTSVSVELQNIKLDRKEKTLAMDLVRSGNRSVMGDILVDHIASGGVRTRISEHLGKAVYVNISKRVFKETLNVPDSTSLDRLNLAEGQLHIQYVEQTDKSVLIREAYVEL